MRRGLFKKVRSLFSTFPKLKWNYSHCSMKECCDLQVFKIPSKTKQDPPLLQENSACTKI